MSRKESRSILFYSKAPMNWVMFERVAERLRRDDRIRIYLRATDDVGRDVVPIYAPFGFRKEDFVSGVRAAFGRFDLYVSADPMLVGKRCRVKIHIFHGISFKGKAIVPRMARYDRLFLFGEYHRRRFVEKGIFAADDPRLAMIGMPKIDALVDGSLDRRAIQERLSIDSSRPTILYAPTWSSRSSLGRSGLEIVESVGKLDVNLLVKLHDLTMLPREHARNWEASIRQFERQCPRLRFVKEHNVAPLLFVSDLLISDASSVANEFLLLDRPIIFVDVPELIEKYRQTIDLDTWGRRTGYVVENVATLNQTVMHALDRPEEHSAIRRAAAADYFHDPGHATDRAVAEIYRLLRLDAQDELPTCPATFSQE